MPERIEIDENLAYLDKVQAWRLKELLRFFPEMPATRAEELAKGSDPELLQVAERLARDGCSADFAYQILL